MRVPYRALALFGALTVSGLSGLLAQGVRPAPQEVIAPPVSASSSLTRLTSTLPENGIEYARVSVNVTPGPYGTAVIPSGGSALANVLPAPVSKFNYPSILLAISSTPIRTPVSAKDVDLSKNPDSIKNVTGDNDVNWMDITFTLKGLDHNRKELVCDPAPCFQIIGLLPGTTTAGSKPQVAANLADATSGIASAVAPALPGGGTALTAATAGIKVLFDTLFPPKTTAFQYAYIDNEQGAQRFGWYFQPNTTTTPPTSILGIQNGQVMLQADPRIEFIEISSVALSDWKHKPSSFSDHFLYSTSDTLLPIQSNAVNYDQLQSLSGFPALIAREEVAKILHTTDDAVTGLITAKTLSTTPDGKYVMTSSLGKYMAP